ncbi:MAG: DUF305 domain-containing protein [Pseudomonadota bacterium]
MPRFFDHRLRIRPASLSLAAALLLAATTVHADVPIVQPGAPGGDTRELSADQAIEIADTSYSPADATFMREMIPHHQQAVEMAAFVNDRTNSPDVRDIAGRIDSAQTDEIAFMKDWLTSRGEPVMTMHEGHSMDMAAMAAMGMATPAQMAELATLQGADFDRLFLQLMIRHHEGAVDMVERLLESPGAAYDPVLFEFTSDITNDQTAEIERMNGMLLGLSDDPRADLAAGFDNAGAAISNLTLVASLPKPTGFFDPANPAGLPPEKPEDETSEADTAEDDAEAEQKKKPYDRYPLLSFANTDMAFFDDVMVAGSYHGFNMYRLPESGVPVHMASVVCPGGQGDVSVIGDLLIMSVEQTRGRLDCGLQGIDEDISDDRFRGLRIFNISDPQRPVQVGAVQTCRGSHTHSVVSGPGRDGKLIVYNSGTSSIREEEELRGCIGDVPGDSRTALFRIDVIEIPVDDPASARIVDSPTVFADDGIIAGLWRGGDHGDDTQETNRTDHCHDITVFPEKRIAAGACSGNGILFDISNPLKPKRIDEVVDNGFAYWHSATFNNDGTKILFTDEWGGGSRPRCRAYDPLSWGADAIYDIVDGKLEFGGYFKIPAPQSDTENCVAHNGSIVPVPGRDIFAQAWYQGGLSLIDFTDSANPVEIAYFDRGPVDEEHLILGGYWSTYWYNGKVYGTEIARGIDVWSLLPSEHLSAEEIAAAKLADQGERFNPQQQYQVTWPADPIVARAYITQLSRTNAVDADMLRDLSGLLNAVDEQLQSKTPNRALARQLRQMAKQLQRADVDGVDRRRTEALSETLGDIVKRIG